MTKGQLALRERANNRNHKVFVRMGEMFIRRSCGTPCNCRLCWAVAQVYFEPLIHAQTVFSFIVVVNSVHVRSSWPVSFARNDESLNEKEQKSVHLFLRVPCQRRAKMGSVKRDSTAARDATSGRITTDLIRPIYVTRVSKGI